MARPLPTMAPTQDFARMNPPRRRGSRVSHVTSVSLPKPSHYSRPAGLAGSMLASAGRGPRLHGMRCELPRVALTGCRARAGEAGRHEGGEDRGGLGGEARSVMYTSHPLAKSRGNTPLLMTVSRALSLDDSATHVPSVLHSHARGLFLVTVCPCRLPTS